MTPIELQRYYTTLVRNYNSRVCLSVANSDRAHNATIIRFMLDTSQNINMFCGEMSVFRKNFYTHIGRNHIGLGQKVKDDLVKSLQSFVERGTGKLNIVLEKFSYSMFKDLISQNVFRTGVQSGVISFRVLNRRAILAAGLSHCTFTDKGIVRMEVDQDSHSAICSVNINRPTLDVLMSNFNIIQRASTPINASAYL